MKDEEYFRIFYLISLVPTHWGCRGLLSTWSPTWTHTHIRYDFPKRGPSPLQRPVPVQHTTVFMRKIHVPGGIRSHNPSKPVATGLRLRPQGDQDRRNCVMRSLKCFLFDTTKTLMWKGSSKRQCFSRHHSFGGCRKISITRLQCLLQETGIPEVINLMVWSSSEIAA